jgi:hypothetical protein
VSPFSSQPVLSNLWTSHLLDFSWFFLSLCQILLGNMTFSSLSFGDHISFLLTVFVIAMFLVSYVSFNQHRCFLNSSRTRCPPSCGSLISFVFVFWIPTCDFYYKHSSNLDLSFRCISYLSPTWSIFPLSLKGIYCCNPLLFISSFW